MWTPQSGPLLDPDLDPIFIFSFFFNKGYVLVQEWEEWINSHSIRPKNNNFTKNSKEK